MQRLAGCRYKLKKEFDFARLANGGAWNGRS